MTVRKRSQEIRKKNDTQQSRKVFHFSAWPRFSTMKTLASTLAFTISLPLTPLFAEVGTVTATTISRGSTTSKSISPGQYSKSESREIGVMVHFGLMSRNKVKSPYEVQCFFMARSSGSDSKIYDSYRQVSDLPYDAEFHSIPLAGKSSSSTSYPIELRFGPMANQSVPGKLTTFSKSSGSTSGGWLIRVMEAGTVVRIESSLPELKDYATKNPEQFDTIIAKVKPTAPSPDRKPATGFGNTLLDSQPTPKSKRER